MKERLSTVYKGHRLYFDSVPLPNGRFAPKLAISEPERPGLTTVEVPPRQGDFDTARAAAEFALTCGMRWVDFRSP